MADLYSSRVSVSKKEGVMQQTESTTPDLHQEASEHYLQGRFAEALTAWRKILASDPSDDRALEGVELCELLTEDSATAADAGDVAEPTSSPAVALSSDDAPTIADEVVPVDDLAEAVDAIDFTVPELEIDLPEIGAESTELPDPDRQSDGIDLGVEAEPLNLAAAAPAPAVVPSSGNAAENELQRRVNDLIAECNEAIQAEDHDTARSLLSRVFILDETNAVGLQLQEQLEGGVPDISEGFVNVEDVDAPDHAAAPGDFDLSAEAPDASEVLAVSIPVGIPAGDEVVEGVPLDRSDSPEPDPQDFMDESVDEFDDTVVEADAPNPSDSVATAAKPKRGIKLPRLNFAALTGRSRLMMYGAVVVIFAVVAAVFWIKLQGVGGSSAVNEPLTQRERPQATEAAAEKPTESQVVMPTEDVPTLMGRADASLRAGNYAAAIVSFNSVLLLDPSHREAKLSMEQATASYKEQQELANAWEQSLVDFREGRYRDALRAFYRLPGGAEGTDPKLERYKANAWFNMGLIALNSGRCNEAQEHLVESATLNPDGKSLATATKLADSCKTSQREAGFRHELELLPARTLDE
jgi:tetratricopeptide (TPR) repeat protein